MTICFKYDTPRIGRAYILYIIIWGAVWAHSPAIVAPSFQRVLGFHRPQLLDHWRLRPLVIDLHCCFGIHRSTLRCGRGTAGLKKTSKLEHSTLDCFCVYLFAGLQMYRYELKLALSDANCCQLYHELPILLCCLFAANCTMSCRLCYVCLLPIVL